MNLNVEILNSITILEDDVFCEILDIKDAIDRERLISQLTDKAKLLGVKAKFEKLLNAYKKKEKELSREVVRVPSVMANYTDFSGKYEQYYCGNWTATDTGISCFDYQLGEKVACSHPILPIMFLENAETGFMKVRLAFKTRGKWKEIVVDKEMIASSNKIVSMARLGVRVTSENSRHLVKYLSDIESMNEDIIQEKKSTSKLGWIGGEFMPFGSEIEFDNQVQFKDAYESIREEGSEEKWLELVRQIRKSDRFEPKISLAGTFASVLVQPLNALSFILNLWGTSGKGKTVNIMLSASVWANPTGFGYVTDPKSTINALEFRMNFLNNFPVLIDDMAQLKDQFKGDFSALVYFLCSGKGKDRANQDLGLNKSSSWKNTILTNAEHSLVTETMQGGAVNRIIDVEMEDGYIFENGNKVVQVLKENYGFAGRRFIDLVEELGIDQIKEIQEDFSDKIKERAKELGVEKEEKQLIPMSIMLTADQIATKYIFKDEEYLDFNKCVDLLKNKDEVSENDRAYDYILSEVSINMNKFKPDDRGEYRGEIWGYIDNGYVVINNNIFNEMCKHGNFSSKSFLSWANKKGLIKGQGDRNTRVSRVDGTLYRCVFLKLEDDNGEFLEVDEVEKLPFD